MRLVAVGVSLGGLDAVRRLLRALPIDVLAPLVLVQHRRHDVSAGPLVSLLGECTTRVVLEPDDKTALQDNHVFVAPAGYHLLVGRTELSLSMEPPVRYARPSIDVLFESAAISFGEELTAVVLTGASDDGAAGAAMVRKCGGRVFVQAPSLSESAVAPLATKARLQPDLEGDIEVLARGLASRSDALRTRGGKAVARGL